MTGLLDGLRVLDFSSVLAGPYCTMLLGDLGADVVKVEQPNIGDDTRRLVRYAGRARHDEDYFYAFNRNKRSVELNLKSPEGRELARQLAGGSDVLVENFRPGVADRLGLGWEALHALNPALIYCSISAYGQDGPAADRPGFDSVIQAMSGLMSVCGEPDGEPTRVGVNLSDLTAPLYAAVGILAALQARSHDGRGRRLDVSLFESLLALMQSLLPAYFATGENPVRLGNGNPNRVPSNAYRTAEGSFIQVAANDRQWPVLCTVLGVSDPRFERHAGRLAHRAELDAELGRLFLAAPRSEWLARLAEAGIPAAPVNSLGEALADPQVASRDLIWALDHPRSGTIQVLGTPFKVAGDEPWTGPRERPPLLGEHTEQVLGELVGLGPAELERLRAAGVIGRGPGRTPAETAAGSAASVEPATGL